MCGIVGYFSEKKGPLDDLYLMKIIRESRIRGLHSFGLSYVKAGGVHTMKYYQNEFREITIPENIKALIYHNRYSTSGDFQDCLNIQPLHLGPTSLVFNGVIDMGTKEEMQAKYGYKMQTANDGEILINVSKGCPELMLRFVNSRVCSFSGLLLNKNNLHAMTNGKRPLYKLHIDDSIFIASTRDILRRAIPFCEPEAITINEVQTWKI